MPVEMLDSDGAIVDRMQVGGARNGIFVLPGCRSAR
jgi:hypothetical protein